MRLAECTLKSSAPYSQSAPIQTKHDGQNETAQEHDDRCWRERMHRDGDGHVMIPPTAFKNCLAEAAKYKSIKIPGKGSSTYTKHFEAGVVVMDPLILPVKADDVRPERLFVPADGRRGGSKRVWKTFPYIPSWEGVVKFYLIDDIISEEVFKTHLYSAGQFIGIGRFRPRNNGYYGRFNVDDVKFSDVD